MTDHPTTEEARPSQYEYDALWARLIEHAPSPLVTKYRDAVEMRLLERLNNESACFDHAHDAALPAPEPLDVERPTDAEVTAELHRVLCMNAKHRSRFTGQCGAGPNIARGLRARLRDEEER